MQIIQTTNKIALGIAALSFILGTILLLLFISSSSDILLDVGLLYVLVAFTLNTITLISLLINSFINIQYHKENLVTILLILLNIPITIAYIMIILNINLTNTPY